MPRPLMQDSSCIYVPPTVVWCAISLAILRQLQAAFATAEREVLEVSFLASRGVIKFFFSPTRWAGSAALSSSNFIWVESKY